MKTGYINSQHLTAVIVLLSLICCPINSHAALVSYTSNADWQSHVTRMSSIDIDDLPDGTVISNQLPGVVFSSFNGGKPLVVASYAVSPPNVLSLDNPMLGTAGGGVTIDFASPKGGVGFWYNDSQFAGNTVTVYNSSDQVLGSYELEFPHPVEWLFVGFTSSNTDISKVVISLSDADRLAFDSFQVAENYTDTDKPYSIVNGKVDENTFQGWQVFQDANCVLCHGSSGQGDAGPNLGERLKTISKSQFVTSVTRGKGLMPSWITNKKVIDNIDKIYVYLKARSDDALGEGKPEKQ